MPGHDALVLFAKTFGLLWMMGFFLVVVVIAYRPGARPRHDRAARSVLGQHGTDEDAP